MYNRAVAGTPAAAVHEGQERAEISTTHRLDKLHRFMVVDVRRWQHNVAVRRTGRASSHRRR